MEWKKMADTRTLLHTCVTAHWAAAMAVLATVAALTLLLSARNTSLI